MSQHIVQNVIYILCIRFYVYVLRYEKFSPRTRPTYLYVLRHEKPGRSKPSSYFFTPIRIRSTYIFSVFTLLVYPLVRPYVYIIYIRSSYPFFVSIPSTLPFGSFFSTSLIYTFYVYDLRIRAPRSAGRDWDEKKGNPLGFTLSIYILYIFFLLTYLM